MARRTGGRGRRRAAPVTGTLLPDQPGNVGVRLSRMIYDDETVGAYRQRGRLLGADRFLDQARRLDVFYPAFFRIPSPKKQT
jgi:hypothetical protein